MATVELPLSFDRVRPCIHEVWVGLESVERILTPVEGATEVSDPVLRLARTITIHCLEQCAMALVGLQNELIDRGDFGEGAK